METLKAAYEMAKKNNGAPGIDGVTFETIEEDGLEPFLQQIRNELVTGTYLPMRNREKQISKGDGRFRTLGIPSIRDRVVQVAMKLILEPIFEADFQDGSYGYRPKRTTHQAVDRVARAVVQNKTRVIDLDLKSYFDNIRHDLLLAKVAKRVNDDEVMRLMKLILKAGGKGFQVVYSCLVVIYNPARCHGLFMVNEAGQSHYTGRIMDGTVRTKQGNKPFLQLCP